MTDDVALTYLGTAGWHISLEEGGLLFDPYFSRIPLADMLFFRRSGAQGEVMKYCPSAVAIFASHGHYDHIMDIPLAAQMTGAIVYGSEQSGKLLSITGLSTDRIRPVRGGETIHPFDGVAVEVFEVPHRKMLGRVPACGPLPKGLKPPLNGRRDFQMDRLFSFRVISPAASLLILNGVDDEPDCEADILIVGPDIADAPLARLLAGVKPRLVMPNHWDDMFRPLSEPPRSQRLMRNPLQRMDLGLFCHRVKNLLPTATVLVPTYFQEYSLREIINARS